MATSTRSSPSTQCKRDRPSSIRTEPNRTDPELLESDSATCFAHPYGSGEAAVSSSTCSFFRLFKQVKRSENLRAVGFFFCSTELSQAGRGEGEKCWRGQECSPRMGPGLCNWLMWAWEGRAKKYKNPRDIKTTCVEENTAESGSLSSSPPQAKTIIIIIIIIIIKKIPAEVTVKSPKEIPSLGKNNNTNEVPVPSLPIVPPALWIVSLPWNHRGRSTSQH